MTGMGFPSSATRQMVVKVSQLLPAIPIVCFVDGDPQGFQILLVYLDGSKEFSYAVSGLACPKLIPGGLFLSDADQMELPETAFKDHSDEDRKALNTIKKHPHVLEDTSLMGEVDYMIRRQKKCSCDGLSKKTKNLLYTYYIPAKLKQIGLI